MEIVLYPDPVLRRRAAEVPAFTPEIMARARAMLELMYQAKGVGLAAPQVGDSVQMLVGNPTGDPAHPEQEFVLVNPRILRKKGNELGEEGCLSFPGIYAEVERSKSVVVSCLEPGGQTVERSFDAFPARIVQHEMDHLTGTLFIDRMSPSDRIRASARLKELEERFRKPL
jgi:peptide deformylase